MPKESIRDETTIASTAADGAAEAAAAAADVQQQEQQRPETNVAWSAGLMMHEEHARDTSAHSCAEGHRHPRDKPNRAAASTCNPPDKHSTSRPTTPDGLLSSGSIPPSTSCSVVADFCNTPSTTRFSHKPCISNSGLPLGVKGLQTWISLEL